MAKNRSDIELHVKRNLLLGNTFFHAHLLTPNIHGDGRLINAEFDYHHKNGFL